MSFFSFGRRGGVMQKNDKGLGKNSIQKDLCETCGERPKFVGRDGTIHSYCGRTCAKIKQPRACKNLSCKDLGRSAFDGYCSLKHAKETAQESRIPPCAKCRTQAQTVRDSCLQCNPPLLKPTGSRLEKLNLRDPTAASLIDNFNRLWKGPESISIGMIYEISLPPDIVEIREAYHSKLASVEKPRQIRTFHGRLCICDLGTNGTEFCSWSSCGICAIIRSAFDTFEFEIKSNSGRFGPGIYSYLEPSLADRWVVSTLSSPYRVMLACEVNLLPPQAEPSESSGILHSREEGPLVFVSGAEAVTPKYLILYSKQ